MAGSVSRLRCEGRLVEVVKSSDRRKNVVKSALRSSGGAFGLAGQFSGVLDAFHGETHFGVAPAAAAALEKAFADLLHERAKMVEPDGTAYDKRSPRILRELAAKHLFRRLHAPAPGIAGVDVQPDEVVVCPYSSTVVLEEACATLARPGGVILSPEGFYKSNALHVAKYGLSLRTIPRADNDFKLKATMLRAAIREAKDEGVLCGVLFTVPGNPIVVEYEPRELAEIAQVLAEEEVRVISDAAFDKFVGQYTPLASLVATVNGRAVPLYRQILTLTGNSKGYNAFGPCKFGAACVGDPAWRAQLQNRFTIMFQRETTHLARTIFETTPEEYFQKNRDFMEAQQRLAREHIQKINDRSSMELIRPFPKSHSGMFLNVEFDEMITVRAGIKSSLILEDMLLLNQGVDSTCLVRMGSPILALRFNILSPRKSGVKNPAFLGELFDRVEAFVRNIERGLTYDQLVKTAGLPRADAIDEDPI